MLTPKNKTKQIPPLRCGMTNKHPTHAAKDAACMGHPMVQA